MQVSFPDADNRHLANLCGVLDENLRQIEMALNVTVARRGDVFNLEGEQAAIAARLLKDFYPRAHKPLDLEEIQLALVEANHWEMRLRVAAMTESSAMPMDTASPWRRRNFVAVSR